MKTKLKIIALFLAFSTLSLWAQDVENDAQYRISLDLNYKIVKGLKLNIEPQLRYDDEFSLDKLLLKGGLQYKTFGFLYWGADYRLIVEPQEYTTAETYNRYGFSLTAKESFGDFTTSARLRYSNYADDDVFDKEFLRYKVKVKYDIPKNKLTPFVSVEAFQELEDNMLYKMRYSTGASYKVKKNNYLTLNYKLDFYNLDYRNKHIISAGYKYNF